MSKIHIKKKGPQGRFLFAVIIFNFLGFVSCNSDMLYEENIDIEDKTWLANDTLDFSLKIEDKANVYNVYYNIRNTITYPYQNLYVNYTLQNPEGDTIRKDLINMTLFDPKTGKPFGNGLGDIFSHQFKVISQYQFPDTGTYHFKLNQFMRRDSLPEIISVGVSVEDAALEE